MNDLQQHMSDTDKRPLPLIVAEKWGFKLAYVYEDDVYWFAAIDWIAGLLTCDGTTASKTWDKIHNHSLIRTSLSKRSRPYIRADGSERETDFTMDKGLYLIVQNLRVVKSRVLLQEIQEYLTKAGAFVDLVRREPEKMLEAVGKDPDKMLDALIKMYKREGKTDEWIMMRINTKIHRAAFTSALAEVMADIAQGHYAHATNAMYMGLWERTAKMLKDEMKLPKNANLRDHQPSAALYYQGLAEDGCARELGSKQVLTWGEAMYIIQDVSEFIGLQARAYGEKFGFDVPTGKPLLTDKN